MSVRKHSLSVQLLRVLLPLALSSTIYLYLYPLFHGCAFPTSTGFQRDAWRATVARHWQVANLLGEEPPSQIPIFRLLVLADPQLEGDSSLPDPDNGFLQRLSRHKGEIFRRQRSTSRRNRAIKKALRELVFYDIPGFLQGLRKRLDLLGNDYYLAHIFRTLHWWSQPTHVTVLGDLLGSQWVADDEFDARAWRFWKRVFAGGQRVNTHEQTVSDDRQLADEVLGDHSWDSRVINVAGNHDIGYAGDISRARIARFEKNFGRADWNIRFHLPDPDGGKTRSYPSTSPSLHVIVLNDLVLDTPALDSDIHSEAYGNLNSIITDASHPVEDQTSFTLLLTHVPLYKPQGVCVDGPLFKFHDSNDRAPKCQDAVKPGGLKEQNHLSEHISRSGILEGIYGMSANIEAPANGKGRRGLILTGHDHEGCDVWHHIPTDEPGAANTNANLDDEGRQDPDPDPASSPGEWQSVAWQTANKSALTHSHTGIREITLRSMMGEFGGNAGLLSLWFDVDANQWQYQMQMCALGVQHIWWGIHVLDLVVVVILSWRAWCWWSRARSVNKLRLTDPGPRSGNRDSKESRSSSSLQSTSKADADADADADIDVPREGKAGRRKRHQASLKGTRPQVRTRTADVMTGKK